MRRSSVIQKHHSHLLGPAVPTPYGARLVASRPWLLPSNPLLHSRCLQLTVLDRGLGFKTVQYLAMTALSLVSSSAYLLAVPNKIEPLEDTCCMVHYRERALLGGGDTSLC